LLLMLKLFIIQDLTDFLYFFFNMSFNLKTFFGKKNKIYENL
jgi:hypothetical protein